MVRALFLLLASGLLTSCLHEPPASTRLAGSLLDALHAQYGAPTQVFNYSPQRVDVFRTAGGGALAVGSNAFLDVTGSPVATPLRLELREIVTKADMVLSGTTSMVGNEVYESAGQYYVQASPDDHRPLLLSPRVKLGLAAPGPPQLFTLLGLGLFQAPAPGPPPAAWQPAADTASSVRPGTVLAATNPLYLRCLIAKGLYDRGNGWVCFARGIYNGYPKTTVRVATGQPAADAGNAAVYLVFHAYNAVAQLVPNGLGEFTQANIPTNTPVTVFALYSADGQLYLGQRQDTVRAGQVFTLNLAPRSLVEIAAEARRIP